MKYALVTGGSRGIGRAICVKLAEVGYNILINFKSNEAEANKTAEMVRKKNVQAELLKFDVSDKVQVDEALSAWLEKNKESKVEILVNNAGIRADALMIWMTDDQWKNVLGSSLDAFYYVTRQVLNNMLAAKYGRIVNIVSLSGIKGLPGQVNYSAAKAGVIGATKALAQEVARRGVTVNAVAPGFIRTDMTQDLNEQELKALIPMKRFGEADEVADAVVFLDSAEARARVRPLAGVEMSQANKAFVPGVLVVPVGTEVRFPNNDTVRHHVYSFSPAKKFELKLYAGTPANPVQFDRPGVVVLGCNIHDRMVGWVVVLETPHHARSAAATGRARVDDVPPGRYTLRTWHSGLAVGAPALEQAITVPAAGTVSASVRMAGLAP